MTWGGGQFSMRLQKLQGEQVGEHILHTRDELENSLVSGEKEIIDSSWEPKNMRY